jgi:site-specific DNA-methyltransferase (adenine-specific)
MSNRPGEVRDAILEYLRGSQGAGAHVSEIGDAVTAKLGRDVPASSVRSYLNLNTPRVFERTARGHYRLASER